MNDIKPTHRKAEVAKASPSIDAVPNGVITIGPNEPPSHAAVKNWAELSRDQYRIDALMIEDVLYRVIVLDPRQAIATYPRPISERDLHWKCVAKFAKG